VYAVSIAVSVVVAILILAPRPEGFAGAIDVSALPWVNAAINTLTAGILVAGFAAIRAGRIALHRRLMTTALGTSSAFLASYVVYHTFSPGPAHYEGPWRGLYLFVLLTHVVLAALILPAALTTWLRGWTGRVADHRRIAPATLAVWLYVSVTGVLVTWMAHG
jgi:putative membrane protein